MNRPTTSTAIPTRALKFEALASMSASFELFCLASGMEALGEMMDHDARAICGPRHARGHDRRAHRWGKTRGKIGFHGGKVEIERPRLRSFEGKEQAPTARRGLSFRVRAATKWRRPTSVPYEAMRAAAARLAPSYK